MYTNNHVINFEEIDRFYLLKEINDILNEQIDANYKYNNYLDIINILQLISKFNSEIKDINFKIRNDIFSIMINKSTSTNNCLEEVLKLFKINLNKNCFGKEPTIPSKVYKMENYLLDYYSIKNIFPHFEMTKNNDFYKKLDTDINNFIKNRLQLIEPTQKEKRAYLLLFKSNLSYKELIKEILINDHHVVNNNLQMDFDFSSLLDEKHNKSLTQNKNFIYLLKHIYITKYINNKDDDYFYDYCSKCIDIVQNLVDNEDYEKSVKISEIFFDDMINQCKKDNDTETDFYSINYNSIFPYSYNDFMFNYQYSVLAIKKNSETFGDNFVFQKLNAEYEKDSDIKIKLYFEQSRLGFGKYKIVENCMFDIIKKDPNYIIWCIINIKWFSVELSILNFNIFKSNKLYLKALEINLAKNLVLETHDSNYNCKVVQEENYGQNFCDGNKSEKYTIDDSYYDAGGGDEWSDSSDFWG